MSIITIFFLSYYICCSINFVFTGKIVDTQINEMYEGINGNVVTANSTHIHIRNKSFEIQKSILKPIRGSKSDYFQHRLLTLEANRTIKNAQILDAAYYKYQASALQQMKIFEKSDKIYIIEKSKISQPATIQVKSLESYQTLRIIQLAYKGSRLFDYQGTTLDVCSRFNWMIVLRGGIEIVLIDLSSYQIISAISAQGQAQLLNAKFSSNCSMIVATGKYNYIKFLQVNNSSKYVIDHISSLSRCIYSTYGEDFIYSKDESSIFTLELNTDKGVEYISQIKIQEKVKKDIRINAGISSVFSTDQSMIAVYEDQLIKIYETVYWGLVETINLKFNPVSFMFGRNEYLIINYGQQIDAVLIKDLSIVNSFNTSQFSQVSIVDRNISAVTLIYDQNNNISVVKLYNLINSSVRWSVNISDKISNLDADSTDVGCLSSTTAYVYTFEGQRVRQSKYNQYIQLPTKIITHDQKIFLFKTQTSEIIVYDIKTNSWSQMQLGNRDCESFFKGNGFLGIFCIMGQNLQIWNSQTLQLIGIHRVSIVYSNFSSISSSKKFLASSLVGGDSNLTIQSGLIYNGGRSYEYSQHRTLMDGSNSFCQSAYKLAHINADKNQVQIINLNTFEVNVKEFSINIQKLIFSNNCQSLLAITYTNSLYWWNISSNKWFYQLNAPSQYHQIISAQYISASNSIIVGDISSGFLSVPKNQNPYNYPNVSVLIQNGYEFKQAKYSSTGRYIILTLNSVRDFIFIYDSKTGEKLYNVDHPSPIQFVVSSSNDQLIAYYANSNIYINSIKMDNQKQYPNIGVRSIKFYLNTSLFITFDDHTYQILHIPATNTNKQRYNNQKHVLTTSFVSNIGMIFLGYSNGAITVCKQNSLTNQTLLESSSTIDNLFFSESTNILYSIYDDNSLAIWENRGCSSHQQIFENGFCTCPVNRRYLNNICSCPESYFEDINTYQCRECNFICDECNEQESNCNGYSGIFYFLVIGVPLICIFSAVGIVVFCNYFKGKNPHPSQLLSNQE